MLSSKIAKKDELLRGVQVLNSLSGRYLKHIGHLLDETKVKPGTVLVRQGDKGSEFYLIVDGQAIVEKNGKNIRRLGPGDFFGEISVIDRGTRLASVISETEMTVMIVSHRSFMELLDTVPGFSKAMLGALCKYIRDAEKPSLLS
jgi:CRP/FNR family transcriptional regulator, cyclic AMP receptor protein